jgi:hypothetical protein
LKLVTCLKSTSSYIFLTSHKCVMSSTMRSKGHCMQRIVSNYYSMSQIFYLKYVQIFLGFYRYEEDNN